MAGAVNPGFVHWNPWIKNRKKYQHDPRAPSRPPRPPSSVQRQREPFFSMAEPQLCPPQGLCRADVSPPPRQTGHPGRAGLSATAGVGAPGRAPSGTAPGTAPGPATARPDGDGLSRPPRDPRRRQVSRGFPSQPEESRVPQWGVVPAPGAGGECDAVRRYSGMEKRDGRPKSPSQHQTSTTRSTGGEPQLRLLSAGAASKFSARDGETDSQGWAVINFPVSKDIPERTKSSKGWFRDKSSSACNLRYPD